jgi:tyrosyl-tRNA synthetase
VLSDLKQRGFIAQMTANEQVMSQVLQNPTAVYAGFDPTAG